MNLQSIRLLRLSERVQKLSKKNKHSRKDSETHSKKHSEKHQTRGQGGRGQGPFTKEEFCQAIDLLASTGLPVDRLRHPAMNKFQYHLIGRNYDITHKKNNCLGASDQFPGYLTVKMRWSKNVRESKHCVLLALGLFLEMEEGHQASGSLVMGLPTKGHLWRNFLERIQ